MSHRDARYRFQEISPYDLHAMKHKIKQHKYESYVNRFTGMRAYKERNQA